MGSVDLSSVGGKASTHSLCPQLFPFLGLKFQTAVSTFLTETLDPEVKILSLSILSPGRPDIVLPLPVEPNSKGVWFTLKEGSHYRLKFTFSVSNNIVSGLRYTNTVWKTGIKGEITSLINLINTFILYVVGN